MHDEYMEKIRKLKQMEKEQIVNHDEMIKKRE